MSVRVPLPSAVMIVSVRSAKIAQRFGTKRTVATGALLAGVALLYTRFTVDSPKFCVRRCCEAFKGRILWQANCQTAHRGIIDAAKAGFVAGMHQALLLGAIVMFVSAVLTFLVLPDQVRRTPDIN